MPEQIRIAQIVFSLRVEESGGGITRFVTDLCRTIDPDRFQLIICTLADYGTDIERNRIRHLEQEGIQIFPGYPWNPQNPYISFLRTAKKFSTKFRSNPVDIIHSHSEFSDILTLWLKMRSTVPVIARTVHDGFRLEWRKRPHRRWLFTNFLYPIYYGAEIGVSPSIANRLESRWLAKRLKRRAFYINNAINLSRFQKKIYNRSALKSSMSIPFEAPVVGTIGRLELEKGYSYLLDAAKIVLDELPDVYFLFVGAGSLMSDLTNQSESLGISQRVIFTGPRNDVEALLGCMDLFACSSLWEGLPTTILESMAAGVPVIATNIPGAQALIKDRFSGWLVPSKNPSALASGIKRMITSPVLRSELAKNASSCLGDFSIQHVARKHEDLYTTLIK